MSPQINQKKLIKFCNDRDIVVTSYCPLGRPIPAQKKPGFLHDAKMGEIAKKYNKTIAQVVLRYLVCTNTFLLIYKRVSYHFVLDFQIDIETIPIPKSVNKKRIEENINVFDFKLTDNEIKYIDTFNTNERVIHFLESRTDKHFPFAIEF